MSTLLVVVLAAALNFGEERPIDTPRVDLAPEGKVAARVAVSDDKSLVIWTDGRADAAELYAARMDRDGTLLDPTGVFVGAGHAGDVVWTGRGWLIAYGIDGWVYVRTMTPEGVLGPPMQAVQTEWILPQTVRMATNGSTVIVVTNAGKGALLSLEGDVRRTISFERSEVQHEFSADVAVANGAYGLAHLTPAGVAFRLIENGGEGASRVLADSTGASSVAIASDGSAFLVIYSLTNLHAQTIAAGPSPDTSRRTLTNFVKPASGEPAARFPSIAWRGGDYLLTFSRGGSIDAQAMRLSRTGEPLSAPATFANITRPSDPHVDVRSDGSGVAVWVFGRAVRAAFFDRASNTPEREREISFSAPSQRDVHVASNGNAFFTGWVEETSRGSEIRVARNLGVPAITVPTGADPTLGDVLVDGEIVWVVYMTWNPTGVWARRYDDALKPLDAAPVRLLPGTAIPRVAAGGGVLAAVWSHGVRFPGLTMSIATPGGDVRFIQLDFENVASAETIAWNGNEFVVAWAQATEPQWWQLPEPVPHHIHALRIGADAILRDPVPLVISDEPEVRITTLEQNGTVFVWQTERLVRFPGTPTLDGAQTLVARFDGAERPPAHVLEGVPPRSLRALTAVGDKHLVIAGSQYFLLSRELRLEDAGALPIPTEDFDVAAVRGVPVLVYSRVAREPGIGGVHRVFIRTAAELPRKRRAVR